METEPIELRFDSFDKSRVDQPFVEISGRGPAVVSRARGNSRMADVTEKTWVVLAGVNEDGSVFREFSVDLDIDELWLRSMIPAAVRARTWGREHLKRYDWTGGHMRDENPGRPPKEWWDRCVAGVAASGGAADPASVCGAQWHHKMSDADKRRITREAEGRLENPGGGVLTAALLLGGVLIGGYLLTRKSDSSSSSSGCSVELVKLNKWAVAKQLIGIYLPTASTPPTLDDLKSSQLGQAINWSTGYPVVTVLGNGDFYKYDSAGSPHPAPEWKKEYCAS